MSLRVLFTKPALQVFKASFNSCLRHQAVQQCRTATYQIGSIHTSARSNSIFMKDDPVNKADWPDFGHVLEIWHYDVVSYGQLKVRSTMPVHVQPVNPHLHPNMNKMFVTILYVGTDKLTREMKTGLSKQYIVMVNLDADNDFVDVNVKSKGVSLQPMMCHIQIPVKFDVRVICEKDGSAFLQNLEGDNIRVSTNHGSCVFKDIKALNVNAMTLGGDINGPTLIQGNISLESKGKGNIMTGRLQGQTIGCHTNQGDISVKAMYAQNSVVSSQLGDVHLGSCHGNVEVMMQEGNLTIDSLDGSLTSSVGTGVTNVFMVKDGVLTLATGTGDINMKLSQSVEGSVSLTGTSVDTGSVAITDQTTEQKDDTTTVTGRLGTKETSTLRSTTGEGTVKLSYQDWYSNLNFSKEETK